jgi:hypothetical protein
MTTTRDALTMKIRRLNELIDRLQTKDEAKLESLQTAGVVKVED